MGGTIKMKRKNIIKEICKHTAVASGIVTAIGIVSKNKRLAVGGIIFTLISLGVEITADIIIKYLDDSWDIDYDTWDDDFDEFSDELDKEFDMDEFADVIVEKIQEREKRPSYLRVVDDTPDQDMDDDENSEVIPDDGETKSDDSDENSLEIPDDDNDDDDHLESLTDEDPEQPDTPDEETK